VIEQQHPKRHTMSAFSTAFLVLYLMSRPPPTWGQATTYCPGDDWVFCARDGQTCSVDPHIKSTMVSYGVYGEENNQRVGKFVFWELTNADSAAFEFYCSYVYLNDPWPGTAGGCCYNQQMLQYTTKNEAGQWVQVARYGEYFTTNGIEYIGYGGNGHYFYRWLNGRFLCENSGGNGGFFPSISGLSTSDIHCSRWSAVNQSMYAQSTFVSCGDTTGGTCSTHVVQNGGSISLLQYGDGTNTHNQYVYSYAYNTNGYVNCNQNEFVRYSSFDGEFCSIHKAPVFAPGVSGSWTLVDACTGCPKLDESITMGTTASSKQATTTEWSQSLSETVKSGVIFESDELSVTTSTSVSDSVENAYSYSASHTCSASCGNGTRANWYMYQWQMKAQQYQQTEVSPFQIFSCVWVCNTVSKPPKCPPGYCKDFGCQSCKPY